MIDLPHSFSTDRLQFRRFQASDVSAYLDMFSYPEVTAFLPAVPDRAAAWRQIAMFEGHWSMVGMSMYAVVEKASGELVGRVGPWMPDERTEPEVGWTIHPKAARQGYAVEAGRACVEMLFNAEPSLTRVVHHIDPNNIPSQATAARIGAHKTAETLMHPEVGLIEIWATPRPTPSTV